MPLQLTSPARGWNPLWLLLGVPLLLLSGGLFGGLMVYVFTHGHTQERNQVTRAQADGPPQDHKMEQPQADGPPEHQQLEPAPAKVQQWEYKIVAMELLRIDNTGQGYFAKQADGLTDLFNKLSQDGWQFQSMIQSGPQVSAVPYALFQRPRR